MKKEMRKDRNSEARTREILILAAKESGIPRKLIDPFVDEGLERYERAVKTANENFSSFVFRNLF